MKAVVVEYKSSRDAYVNRSVYNANTVSAKDLEDTKKHCESRGGYFRVLAIKEA